MRILKFEAENIKRLKTVEITPTGNVVEISGKNEQGKSSVLDAIFYCLAGGSALPSQPIRKGEQTARVTLDLGEVIVTRKFTASGSTLVVEADTGARFPKPQTMLDELIGAIAFDPLVFIRMEPKQQLDTMRKLVKIDVDIDALDGKNKRDFEERTEWNRRAKAARARAETIEISSGLPAERLNVEDLVADLEKAGQANTLLERRKQQRIEVAKAIEVEAKRAVDLRARAAELRAEADRIDAAAKTSEDAVAADRKKLEEAEALGEPVDTAAIRLGIENATRINRAIEQRDTKRNHEAEAEAAEKEAAQITANMDERTALRTKAIAEAKMPVEGLSFGDGEVLFNDLPLNQASAAGQIRVSVAIAMAMNPKLRVLRIKDGSLLDNDSMALIANMADSADYQIWIESVQPHGPVSIVMEDGAIKPPEAGQAVVNDDAKEQRGEGKLL